MIRSRSRSGSRSRHRHRSRSPINNNSNNSYKEYRAPSTPPTPPLPPQQSQQRQRSPHYRGGGGGGGGSSSSTSRCLGVFGLSTYTTESTIQRAFDAYGRVERVKLVTDPRTNRSRGFGFIYFNRAEDASVALQNMHKTELDGHVIRVDFSISSREHQPTPGVYMGSSLRRDSYSYRRYGGADNHHNHHHHPPRQYNHHQSSSHHDEYYYRQRDSGSYYDEYSGGGGGRHHYENSRYSGSSRRPLTPPGAPPQPVLRSRSRSRSFERSKDHIFNLFLSKFKPQKDPFKVFFLDFLRIFKEKEN